MADTVLKSIAFRNWTTVKEASIEFPERGLVLVRGINSAARGKMSSIGSGKTALGEAISRTLFNVRGRFTHLKDFSTRGKGNAYVCVDCLHKGRPLKVEMGFKCEELSPSGEGLKFTYDGTENYRSHLEETREDLVKVLTVPADLAAWTVHLDGDMLNFHDLSEAKSVELLMAALMQPRWNVCAKSTNDKASDLKRQQISDTQALEAANDNVRETDVELQTAQANLQDAKTVYDQEVRENKAKLKKTNTDIAELDRAMKKRDESMATIKKEIERRVNLNAAKEKAAEIIVNEKQEAKDQLNEELSPLRSAEATARRDLEYAQRHLERAKETPADCPTCGKAWDKAETAIKEHTDDVTAKQTAYKKAAKAVSTKSLSVAKAQDAWLAAKTALDEIKAEAPIDDLSLQYEDLEGTAAIDNDQLITLQQERVRLEQGPDKTEITRFETQVKEREKSIKKAHQGVDKAAAKLTECQELLRVVGYWQDAFSPTGIPNMILGDALGPLNAVSRRVSAMMSGGTLGISYATSRQLAKGGDKAELTINVQNELGAHRADGSSKGEGGLNNLIIAETLAEVGGIAHRIGYRWYDEVGANQDEVVRRSIYAYLSEVAQRYSILVFLVSHAPEAANYVDYTLVAEKTLKGTTYRWD